jgi:nitrogen fixation protein NifU and related proteins
MAGQTAIPGNTPESGFTETFLIHAFTPRNVGALSNPDGYGAPLSPCGDSIEISLKIEHDRIVRVVFISYGCAHTTACASVATTLAEGLDVHEATAITAEDIIDYLGGLPSDHHHCARLAANALQEAIRNYEHTPEQSGSSVITDMSD